MVDQRILKLRTSPVAAALLVHNARRGRPTQATLRLVPAYYRLVNFQQARDDWLSAEPQSEQESYYALSPRLVRCLLHRA
jgi:hypothetical protein